MKLFQQGDVLFKSVNEVPKGKIEVVGSGIVEEGEASGHYHRFTPSPANQLIKVLGAMYLIANEMVRIQHEEHNEITLPPGVYFVDKVKEYDHFLEETRRVVD
jgi:hypothetical protein